MGTPRSLISYHVEVQIFEKYLSGAQDLRYKLATKGMARHALQRFYSLKKLFRESGNFRYETIQFHIPAEEPEVVVFRARVAAGVLMEGTRKLTIPPLDLTGAELDLEPALAITEDMEMPDFDPSKL